MHAASSFQINIRVGGVSLHAQDPGDADTRTPGACLTARSHAGAVTGTCASPTLIAARMFCGRSLTNSFHHLFCFVSFQSLSVTESCIRFALTSSHLSSVEGLLSACCPQTGANRRGARPTTPSNLTTFATYLPFRPGGAAKRCVAVARECPQDVPRSTCPGFGCLCAVRATSEPTECAFSSRVTEGVDFH